MPCGSFRLPVLWFTLLVTHQQITPFSGIHFYIVVHEHIYVLLIYLCVCMCMWSCVQAHVYVWRYASMCMWRAEEDNLGPCFSDVIHFPTHIPKASHWLSALGNCLSPLLQHCDYLWIFFRSVGSGDQTRVPMLAEQALYQLSRLSLLCLSVFGNEYCGCLKLFSITNKAAFYTTSRLVVQEEPVLKARVSMREYGKPSRIHP